MSEKVLTLTDETFEQEVLHSDKPVLVDFWAAWCGPCRALGPVIDQLADHYSEDVKVAKLNIDDNPNVTAQMGVKSIPAVLIFHRGELVDSLVGVRPLEGFTEALDSVLQNA